MPLMRRKVVVMNVPVQITRDVLGQVFSDLGGVVLSLVLHDLYGKSQGTGFVQYYCGTEVTKVAN